MLRPWRSAHALGFVAAQANSKAFVTGHLFPSLIPSSRTWITGRDFGRFVNPLLWRFASRVVARTTDPLYSEVLSAFGLPRKKHLMLKSGHSPIANLVAISPRILPHDPSWPSHYECTGYWTLADGGYEPDPGLRAFVEEGEPPVVVTFGSMFGIDSKAMTSLLVQAVAGCGRRVVLQAGWAGLGEGALPDHVRRAEFVSHEWLFRRAACIVHHGGAGTTGAALRAGKPQVITYHLGDQQFWCRHMLRLGVSAGGIAQRGLSAGWLARAVRRALSNRTLAKRGADLAARLATEDGVGRAVQILEHAADRARAA
jgi:sterol 3beta-glucosyltransferase